MKPSQLTMALAILAATSCLRGAAAGADMRPSSDAVVVNINGKQLTLADLERKRPGALFQALTNYYEAQRKTIDEIVDEYVLEQQAQKEGVTVTQLLERHVNSAIAKDPSEETLRVYYEGVETAEPYEAVRVKIIDALRQRRIAKAKTAYVQSLRGQGNVSIRLAPPRAPISMMDTPVRGPHDARVTLLEYADYECPYCQQIQPIIDKLVTEYKGVMAFAYKDYPLPMHANSQKAAEATRCAGAQGEILGISRPSRLYQAAGSHRSEESCPSATAGRESVRPVSGRR